MDKEYFLGKMFSSSLLKDARILIFRDFRENFTADHGNILFEKDMNISQRSKNKRKIQNIRCFFLMIFSVFLSTMQIISTVSIRTQMHSSKDMKQKKNVIIPS